MNYKEVINKWKLNQSLLAALIEMPAGTFKNKFSDNQTAYKFTGIEEHLIIKNLRELANDIFSIDAGITFSAQKTEPKKFNLITKKPIIKDLNKERLGEKVYNPNEENPRYKIVNGKKIFK